MSTLTQLPEKGTLMYPGGYRVKEPKPDGYCDYCERMQATGIMITGCSQMHVQQFRVCNHCYQNILKGIRHVCLECNNTLLEWAMKLDSETGVWITSWDRRGTI